jgi:glycerol-3-phosphate dehydrogenase
VSRSRLDDFHVTGKPLAWDAQERPAALAQARGLDFDLIIIGGGITGAGIAREAALRGISFLLVDQDDFAAGTSSRSSKLVHGGMRYLSQGEFRLVREATTERNWLQQALPNLVRPQPFHWCAWRGGKDSRGRIRLGLALYDLLSDTFSRFRNAGRRRFLTPAELAAAEPAFARDGLLLAGRYFDCNVDDARLTLETLKEARDLSGGRSVALNHVRAERILLAGGRVRAVELADQLGGSTFAVRCGCVLNATGVWTDATLARAGLASRLIRPTKGVHLVVPNARIGNHGAFALRSLDDGRSFFVLRRGEVSLIGTTDTDYQGSPENPRCEAADADYLLRTVNALFPEARLTCADILSTYAGIRPLIREEGRAASAVSRRHLIQDPGTGVVTIAGGKLTTFRTMAFEALQRCSRSGYLRPLKGAEARRDFSRRPYKVGLDRAGFDAALARLRLQGLLPEPALAHLHQQYGHGALGILREVRDAPAAGAPLLPGLATCAAELHHILAFENAPSLMDVMLRRTELQLRVSHTLQPVLAARVAAIMGCWYGWDEGRRRDEVERYLAFLRTTLFFQAG